MMPPQIGDTVFIKLDMIKGDPYDKYRGRRAVVRERENFAPHKYLYKLSFDDKPDCNLFFVIEMFSQVITKSSDKSNIIFEIDDIVTLKPWDDIPHTVWNTTTTHRIYISPWVKKYCGKNVIICARKLINNKYHYMLRFDNGIIPNYWFAEDTLYTTTSSNNQPPMSFEQLMKGAL